MYWCFIGSCFDHESLAIHCINVWACRWDHCLGETAEVQDPIYHQLHTFPVYELALETTRIRIAAGEFSNGVWGFYASPFCAVNAE
jgi:hypothetical protein